MAIFGRSFPSRSHPFGVIAAPAVNGVIETINNVGVASFTLTSAEAQNVSQSGSATLALTAEATKETESNIGVGSNTLADYPLDVLQTSGSSTTALTAEATKESPQQSATGSQTLTGEKTSDTESNSAAGSNSLGIDATGEIKDNIYLDYSAVILNDNPIVYYRLDEASGQFLDSSGHGLTTVSITGTPTYSQTRAKNIDDGTSVLFTAAQKVQSPGHFAVDNPNLAPYLSDGDHYTLEAWAKTTESSFNIGIWSFGVVCHLCIDGSAGGVVKFFENGPVMAHSSIAVNDGQWHHIVARYDGDSPTTNNAKIFVDGVDVTVLDTNRDQGYDTNHWGFGAKFFGFSSPDANSYFNGNLDELVRYEYALTNAQILNHYNAGSGLFGIPPSSTQTITTYLSDTTGNSGSGSQNTTEKVAETESNSSTGSQTFALDATAETISNSATNSQTIDESIVVPSVADTLDNQGTASFVLTEKHSESDGSSGSGTQALTAEATAESLTNTATATTRLGIDATVDTESNSATATTRLSETESDSQTNTGTGSSTSSEAIAETDSNSATASQTLLENIQLPGDVLDNVNTGSQTISESVAESPQNVATSDQLLTERQPEVEDNTAIGTQNISEALAETVNNTGTASQTITDQVPETNMTSTGMAVHTLSEQIAETLSTSETSSQTMAQAIADTDSNSGTGTPAIDSYEGDVVNNSGTGSHITSDATAEAEVIAFLASQYIDDVVTTRVVPFSDITTGTWTVAPLYEKVDEIFALSGYPTESIRSGNNPVNDAAVLGLTPTSDPGTDENFYLNVQFWRDGADGQLDFTLKLKEGSNVIATRTFTNVTETESAPRVERIAITPLEASAIVDFANLNVELIANEV